MISTLCLQSKTDGIVIDLVCINCALMWCSLFCYFGSMASYRLPSIGYAVYSANWYDCPLEWQKSIVLVILRSQELAHFNGLNLIDCSLEVLGQVKNSFHSISMVNIKYFCS